MSVVKSYRELDAWQRAMSLVESVYSLTGRFPKEELYGLVSQMRRSAVSIPSNIAEGWGRRDRKDYLRFLRTAYGSLMELETQMVLSVRLGFATRDDTTAAWTLCQETGKLLNGLRRGLEQAERNSTISIEAAGPSLATRPNVPNTR
jgi:four helix bundle protein